MELLYRSLASVLLRLRRVVKVRGLCLEAAEQDTGSVEGWRMDQTRASLDGGGRRRRVAVQDRRSLGCDPGRWAIGEAFISSVWVSAYCDSSKPCGDMVPPDLVRKTANRRLWWLPAVAGGSRFGKIGGVEGPRVFNVILWFVRGVSAKFLLSVSFFFGCTCTCTRICTVFLTSIQVCLDKKKISLGAMHCTRVKHTW